MTATMKTRTVNNDYRLLLATGSQRLVMTAETVTFTFTDPPAGTLASVMQKAMLCDSIQITFVSVLPVEEEQQQLVKAVS